MTGAQERRRRHRVSGCQSSRVWILNMVAFAAGLLDESPRAASPLEKRADITPKGVGCSRRAGRSLVKNPVYIRRGDVRGRGSVLAISTEKRLRLWRRLAR